MMTFGLFGKHVFSFGLLLAVALTALPAPGGSAQRVEAAGMPTVIVANNQSDTIIVTVRAGDTLSSIARRYNTTVYTLVQPNQSGIRTGSMSASGCACRRRQAVRRAILFALASRAEGLPPRSGEL